MDGADDPWVDCEFLSYMSRHDCVLRISATGAIICVHLKTPLDVSRACLVSVIRPIPARVRLANFMSDENDAGCELEIQWPTNNRPPPENFARPAYKSKKRKLQP